MILETGAYAGDPISLLAVARAAMAAGAAMLKTSTGEGGYPRVSSFDVSLLAEAVRDHSAHVGLKVSGGVDLPFAREVIAIAERSLGPVLTPARFRIGASRLLDELTGVQGRGSY